MIEGAAMLIVDRLASGQCIELMESRFLNDIIQRYSSNSRIKHDHHHHNDHEDEHGHEEKPQQHIDEKGMSAHCLIKPDECVFKLTNFLNLS